MLVNYKANTRSQQGGLAHTQKRFDALVNVMPTKNQTKLVSKAYVTISKQRKNMK